LAGANVSPDKDNTDIEDGYITAADIALLNLKGMECAVISCCETGLGRYLSGAGVFSFKWAFGHAGARYLILSLWKIPDRETVEVLNDFYANHHYGEEVWKALLESQRTYLVEHAQDGKSHPFYWAAFICQGNPLFNHSNPK